MILDLHAAKLVADLPENAPSFGAWLGTLHAELERQAQQAVRAERERIARDVRGSFECPRCGGEYPEHRDFCVWYLAKEAR